MSDAKRSDSERRDPTLARLLSEALHAPDASGGAAGDSECPDAELLAAYADQGLGAQETARWESHFAGCARCQQILAVLTASGEEPLTDAELERFGRLAATASIAAERGAAEKKKIVIPWRPRATWRWLAPAAGIAAAAALWFALRPTPPRGTPVMTADKTTAEPFAAAPNESQIAEANVPPPPAAAGNSRAVPEPRAAEKKQEQTATQAQGAPSVPPAALETDRLAAPAQLQGNPSADASSALKAPAAKAKDAESATAGTVTEAAPRQAVPAAPSASAPTAPGGVGGGVAAGAAATGQGDARAFAARSQVAGLAKISAAPVVFASPDRSALWRIGLGGRIERSADQGQIWQQQASGVTSDLLAGAAPSNTVAWVAGRGGVILRTIDGEHWQRVTSPARPANGAIGGRLDSAAAATDWTGVSASDALHATVISADRRLVTEDGGQTWKQQ